MNGFFITGTDTNIGKTIATAVLGLLLQKQGKKVRVLKPVASGGSHHDGLYVSDDALFLKKTLRLPTPLDLINPICFHEALAPKVAAEIAGKEVDLTAISVAVDYYRNNERPDILLVEGVGGILVPIKHDYLVVDMIRDLKFPVIVVTRPGLGTINHTLLTTSFLKQEKIPIAGIIINHSNKNGKGVAERTNPQEIRRLSGLTLLGEIPFIDDLGQLEMHVTTNTLNISALS